MIEFLKNKKSRLLKIVNILSAEYPKAGCHLYYNTPFELLISTILAAQCTDNRVNLVMKPIYEKYKSPRDFLKLSKSELERMLSSINFYRNKTKSIIDCCKTLEEKYNGKVPDSMEELIKLTGVGRKTANVVLGNCFGKPAIMVDTHLKRVSLRLGFTEQTDPDKIEEKLKEVIPENIQTKYSYLIGEHGRVICKAKKPLCENCVISNLCPSENKF
jgi:endonuclease-3